MESTIAREFIAPQKRMKFWSIFLSPIATLESLSQEPRYFLALLAGAVYSTATSYYAVSRVGLARLVTAAAKASGAVDPDAMLQNAAAHGTQIIVAQSAFTFLGGFLTA